MRSLQVIAFALLIVAGGGYGVAAWRSSNPDPRQILQDNQRAMLALKTYRAVCSTSLTYDPPRTDGKTHRYQLAVLTAEKPNKMRYESWPVDTLPAPDTVPVPIRDAKEIAFVCDGKKQMKQFGRMYRPDENATPEALATILEPWEGFYSEKTSILGLLDSGKADGNECTLSYGGTERLDGVLCDIVLVHTVATFQGETQDSHAKYLIGQKDHLVRRETNQIVFGGNGGYTRDDTIHQIKVNEPVTSNYAYVPPQGVSLEKIEPPKPLLATGTAAPGFSAKDMEGKEFSLSDFRGKVVVIDFWASWCPPCKASMPHTQEVIKRLSEAGIPVVALAVDDGEKIDGFKAWVSANRAAYPDLKFLFSDPAANLSGGHYRVTGIPTQYIVDKHGVIRASIVGYGGPDRDLEDAIRAAAGN